VVFSQRGFCGGEGKVVGDPELLPVVGGRTFIAQRNGFGDHNRFCRRRDGNAIKIFRLVLRAEAATVMGVGRGIGPERGKSSANPAAGWPDGERF